jgi:hypothetical protein
MQLARVFDGDTGAGTELSLGVILRKTASGGSVEAGTSTNPLRVDPTGTTTQPVSGTVSITANSSVNVNQVAGTGTATGNGTASAGCQRVTIASDNTAFAVNATSTGNVANGSSDSGNPIKIGGVARQTNPTAVSDTQRVNAFYDDVGREIVVLNQCRDLVGSQTTTITASTSETTIVTAGSAGVFNDLTSLAITNSSSTALIVTLKDSTGGTTRGIYALAANGGIVLTFPTPKAQSGAAANWTLTCGSSVSSIYVVAEFVKNV